MRRASATSRTACPIFRFYEPTDRGLEAKIADRLDRLRAKDRAARSERRR